MKKTSTTIIVYEYGTGRDRSIKYERVKAHGYAYRDEVMQLDCIIARNPKAKNSFAHTQWYIYDTHTGAFLGITAPTREEVIKAWHDYKARRSLTREDVTKSQERFAKMVEESTLRENNI